MPAQPPESVVMTYREASAYLNLPLGTLYWMVAQNRLPYLRYSARVVRFQRESLDRWLAERRRGDWAVEAG